MSLALAGLFVVNIAAPASADDTSKYFPPQRVAQLHAMYRASYAGCEEKMSETGWSNRESYFFCGWRHNHMRVDGRRARANDPVSYRP
jgi:hypothetical protein